MKTIIRISIAIFLITTLNAKAQHSTKFKEFNAGIYCEGITFGGPEGASYNGDLIFPGFSFLCWKQHIFLIIFCLIMSMVLHYQLLLTGKIGLGIGNSDNTVVIGIRPFPTSGYLQYTRKEKHLF